MNEVYFLPADKHKNLLQNDSITLGVHIQTYHPKQQLYKIFSLFQEKREGLT